MTENLAKTRDQAQLNAPAPCAVTGCQGSEFMQHPVALCLRHAVQVSVHMSETLHATALVGAFDPLHPADLAEAPVADAGVWGQASHEPVVYFLANGDRVKIGVSTSIASRVVNLSLRRGNVLLLLEGSYELETALHAAFASDRVGTTEWFVLSTHIRDFIARKKAAVATLRPAAPEKSTAVPVQRAPVDRRHPRRAEITQRVQDCGGAGTTLVDLRRWLAALHPGEQPPSDTAMQNWFAAHPNITKPGRGTYVWTDSPTQ